MQENRIRIDFGWKSFLSFFGSRLQARTGEKFRKKYILKIHKYYIHLQKQALKMQTNSIRIDFGWKSFISFFGLRPQARTCEKIWKKKYFVNPPILCSIATADPENARDQSSNRFWLKKFPFNFWLMAAGADLRKVLKKTYFENPPILWSIATAGHKNLREQNWNRFWLKKFHFIFWLKAAGADLRKVL